MEGRPPYDLVFGLCVGGSGKFERVARPALERHYPGQPVLVRRDQKTIAAAYNSILDEATTTHPGSLVVLIHDDTEMTGSGLVESLASAFAQPSVGVVGVVGGRHTDVMTWWRGECFGRVEDAGGIKDFGGGTHDVDTVDGLLLALSPDVATAVRFDEGRYRGFHGYDADYCARVRASGRRVLVTELPVRHRNRAAGHYGNFTDFHHAALTWQLRWAPATAPRRAWWTSRRLLLDVVLWRQRRSARQTSTGGLA